MSLQKSVVTLISLAALAFPASALACGDDKHEKDEKEPSVLCGDEKEKKDEKEPSAS